MSNPNSPDPAEDPLAARSAGLFRLFGVYLRYYFWRNFRAVRVSRAGPPVFPAGRPVIIFTNHPSWWDPALFILLCNTTLRDRISFGPMEEASLRQYGLLRRMGVFGIDPASARGAARFLEVSLRVLREPRAALWITAEGHFADPRRRPLQLRAGLAHLARRVPDAVLVPMAMEYVFWNERKPEALLRFGTPIEAGRQLDVAGWTARLAAALTATMDGLAAESATRDSRLFTAVVQSGGGVGGLYDLWRRGRAMARGQRARLSHGVEEDAVRR